jgi:hypothetical protein
MKYIHKKLCFFFYRTCQNYVAFRVLTKFGGVSCGKAEKISEVVTALLVGQEFADHLAWVAWVSITLKFLDGL